MAVHFFTRPKTRFIPLFFVLLMVASFAAIPSRANASSLVGEDDDADTQASDDSGDLIRTPQDELRSVMSQSVDPSRLNRVPGFSPVIVAHTGERPTTGIRAEADPSESADAARDFSDRLPTQPPEAVPDQR